MACLLHTPVLLLTTLIVVVNLSLNPVLGHTLLCGIEESNMQEEGAPEALEYAVSQYNENNSDIHVSHVMDVRRVQKQVVAGTNFYFDVILGQTTCMKSQDNLTYCPLNDQAVQQKRKLCAFIGHIEAWENQMPLIRSSCLKT